MPTESEHRTEQIINEEEKERSPTYLLKQALIGVFQAQLLFNIDRYGDQKALDRFYADRDNQGSPFTFADARRDCGDFLQSVIFDIGDALEKLGIDPKPIMKEMGMPIVEE